MSTAGTTTHTATDMVHDSLHEGHDHEHGGSRPGRPQPMSTLTMTTAKDPHEHSHGAAGASENRRCPSAK